MDKDQIDKRKNHCLRVSLYILTLSLGFLFPYLTLYGLKVVLLLSFNWQRNENKSDKLKTVNLNIRNLCLNQ